MPPCNLTAERSVLGGLMLEIESLDTIAPQIPVDDFYQASHQLVFKTMLAMRDAGKPINANSMFDELARLGRFSRNEDVLYLNELMAAVPGGGTANISYDCKLVREAAQRRRLIYAARELESAAYDHEGIDDLSARLDRVRQDIIGTGATTMPPRFSLDLITSDQFAAANYRLHFLIRRILVEGQPCVLGGPKKTLKTSLLVDLAFSLATGTPFLSDPDFSVPDPVNVAMLSGESGSYTLQETGRRIALARGRILSQSRIFWGFKLPQLGNVTHLEELAKQIREHDIKVAIIDPAYLCLLSAGMNTNITSNVFGMGALLKGISEMATDTDCTPIIAHHTRKGDRNNLYAVPDLEDLSGSGFAEWARQWLLLNRREAYEAGTGEHRLWLNSGGSAGHSGTWALNITEGTIGEEGDCRTWDVVVMKAKEAVQQSHAAKEAERTHREQQKHDDQREAILKAYRLYPDGETSRTIRDAAGVSSAKFGIINTELLAEGRVVPCRITKNKREESAFRLLETERCDGGTITCPAGTVPPVPPAVCGGGTHSPPLGGVSHPPPPRRDKATSNNFGNRDI